MNTLKKMIDRHSENMRPGSSIPYTQEFIDAWEIRVSYEKGLKDAFDLAIDRAKYTRFSTILRNDEYTAGYIEACRDITRQIEKLLTES